MQRGLKPMTQITTNRNKFFLEAEDAIIDAFFSLLDKYSFDEITVTQMIVEANINRSTFYRHYRDKYDILDQILESARAITVQLVSATLESSGESSKESSQDLFSIILDKAKFDMYFSETTKKRFLQLTKLQTANFNLHEFMVRGFMNEYSPSVDSIAPELEKEIFADIIFRMILHQMQNANTYTKSELKTSLQLLSEQL